MDFHCYKVLGYTNTHTIIVTGCGRVALIPRS